MIRRGTVGLCVVALLAIAGVGAASASAAEYELRNLPEFGRCGTAVAKTGEYNGKNCIAHKAAGGNHSFLPGPGAKKKFTAFGEGIALETTGKTTIECGGAEETGEYNTNPKTETVTVNLIGCVNETTQLTCQSNPLKTGEIESQALEAEIGFIKGGSKATVGLDLKAKAPATALFTFECGKLPESIQLVTVEGSVIAQITKLNKPVEEFKTVYKELAGKQSVQQFEGGPKDTLTATIVTGLSSTKEEAGFRGSFEILNEELLEIKAKETFH